jgi:predicted negative regulator of RcsB-dependent stress response
MTLKQLQTPANCLALAAATLLVFSRVVHHDFINVDDNLYVYKNPHVSAGLTWNGIVWAFTHAHGANWHPLTWLSHMLDCQFYGLRPGGHHLTNVLLHAANAVLLFLVLRRMTSTTWQSALVAALFAIHPLRVESVAWIAERKDVLSGLFFMLTLWAYVKYVSGARCQVSGEEANAKDQRQETNAKGQRLKAKTLQPSAFSLQPSPWYWLTLLFFALGLMSKPMLVTLPFVLLLLDYWPLNRVSGARCQESGANPRSTNLTPDTPHRALLLEKLPLLALVVVAAALTIWAQGQMSTIMTTAKLPLPWRLANAAVSYVVYVGQMVFPYRLAAYYPHPFGGLPSLAVFGAVLALVVATAAVIVLRRRFAYLPVGWFWYLGMLVPVIGLVQVGEQSHADRYTYLSQIGLYLIVAWGWADVSRRWLQRRWIVAAGGLVCLIVLAACAWRQTQYWRNSEILWKRTLACTSPSWAAENFLGDYLSDNGRMDEALAHFRRAAELSPNTAAVRFNLGFALYQKSQLAEAQQELEAALQLNPDMTDARIGLGVVLYSQGIIEPAIQQYQQVLARNPTNTAALSNLGVALESLGRIDDAIAHYRRALEIDPGLADAQRNLTRVLNGRPSNSKP